MNNDKRQTTNEKPLISIITVVLNGKKHIAQTIESVINQKHDVIEYILIDGGSTDGTLDIISKYNNKIDKLISEPDAGIYDAMNKGLYVSTGTWVWFLNSDDYLDENVISKIVSQKEKMDSYDIIYGNLRRIGKKYSYIIKERNLLNLKKTISFNHPSTLTKRELLIDVGGFNTKYKINADYDMFLRLTSIMKNIHYINEVLTNMRHGGVSEKLGYTFRRIKERFLIDRVNVNITYAYKNLLIYTLPGFIKKVLRLIFEKIGFTSFVDLYFKKKYRTD